MFLLFSTQLVLLQQNWCGKVHTLLLYTSPSLLYSNGIQQPTITSWMQWKAEEEDYYIVICALTDKLPLMADPGL